MADWHFHIDWTHGDPSADKIALVRNSPPKIFLEVEAPGVQSLPSDEQIQTAMEVFQDALSGLQAALETPSEIAGFRSRKT